MDESKNEHLTNYQVKRTYNVSVPEKGSKDREVLEDAIANDAEDAIEEEALSDEGVAEWLTYQYDVGNFTEYVEWGDEETYQV